MEQQLTMKKLQQLVYFIEHVPPNKAQREVLQKAVYEGILRGSIDPDALFPATAPGAPSWDVSAFIRELEQGPGGLFHASELYTLYAGWCEQEEQTPMSPNQFGGALRDFGVTKLKRKDANYYVIAGTARQPDGEGVE